MVNDPRLDNRGILGRYKSLVFFKLFLCLLYTAFKRCDLRFIGFQCKLKGFGIIFHQDISRLDALSFAD